MEEKVRMRQEDDESWVGEWILGVLRSIELFHCRTVGQRLGLPKRRYNTLACVRETKNPMYQRKYQYQYKDLPVLTR